MNANKFSGWVLSTVVLLGITNASYGATSKEMLKEASDFFKNSVMGKTISVSSVSKIAENTVEAHFNKETTFANLVVEQNGFSYDEIIIIKQTNYPLNADGSKGEPQVKDRAITARFHYQAL